MEVISTIKKNIKDSEEVREKNIRTFKALVEDFNDYDSDTFLNLLIQKLQTIKGMNNLIELNQEMLDKELKKK